MREVHRRTDLRSLKIFLPAFQIQSEILTDFRILQLQRIADSSVIGARILDFACNENENIFARISDSKRDFNGFPDPAIAADCRFIRYWGPDIGLCM